MRNYLKKIGTLLLLFILTLNTITPIETKALTEDNHEKTAIEKLEEASIITIKERLFSINESYNIYVDNEKIAQINGKYISFTGDVFKMTDMNGTEIASEKQIKRWNIKLNRLAEVFDSEGNTTGYIGEKVIKDLLKFGTTFHFFDNQKNEIAEFREDVFNLLAKFNVKDNQGKKLYTVKQKLSFTSKYEISVLDSNPNVSITDVIFATCIMNEIRQAKKEEK